MIHTRRINFSDDSTKMVVEEPLHLDYTLPKEADGATALIYPVWRDINYYCKTFQCELKQVVVRDHDPGRKEPHLIGIFEGVDPYDIWGYHNNHDDQRSTNPTL